MLELFPNNSGTPPCSCPDDEGKRTVVHTEEATVTRFIRPGTNLDFS